IPTLCGFLALALCFYRTQSIIMSTLSGAVTFGLVFKMMMMFT
ncbi:MAG: L-valine transporter subunit YgaH, partial [Enterobacterales bacterium]|nr:L-valine transporter subunit YgaH [Enterobacterales bacterium]